MSAVAIAVAVAVVVPIAVAVAVVVAIAIVAVVADGGLCERGARGGGKRGGEQPAVHVSTHDLS
jgi:hypothetical protein